MYKLIIGSIISSLSFTAESSHFTCHFNQSVFVNDAGVYQAKNWDGIGAHWRANHEDVRPYSDLLRTGSTPI